MKKLIFALLLAVALPLLPSGAQAQTYTKAIIAQALAPSPTGFGGTIVISSYYQSGQSPTIANDAQVDSVWAVLQTSNKIGSTPIYNATEVQAPDSTSLKAGRYNVISTYPSSGYARPNLLEQYRVSQWTPVFFETGSIDGTASAATTTVGVPQSKFLVTGVYYIGANDTAGYTSNVSASVGTNSSSYNNITASTAVALGSPTAKQISLASPYIEVPAGTAITVKNATAAVATTEHYKVIVTGLYE